MSEKEFEDQQPEEKKSADQELNLGQTELSELDHLLIELESETLDDSKLERLREILKQDSKARQEYLQWQMIRAAMALESEFAPPISADKTRDSLERDLQSENSTDGHVTLPTRIAGEDSRRFAWWASAAIVVTLITSVTVAWIKWNQGSTGQDQVVQESNNEKVEKTAQGVAIITKLVDVTWGEDQNTHETGDAISPGTFSIQAGLAQIEFFSGATLVVEGPAELELASSSLAKVIRGKLRANVPQIAKGFTLEVDGIKVIDLGTEFGLSVEEGRTDVQVFDGLVEVHADSKDSSIKKTVRAGDAITRSSDGSIRAIDNRPDEFVTLSELETRQNQQVETRAQLWRDWSQTIRNDPRVIAYYSFDQKGSWYRKLKCDSPNHMTEQTGAIIGARRVPGRWGSKGGLEFKRPGDRVRMSIPGEFNSLTFAAWVKIDSPDRMYNSLFLTDNYNQGEPHWQILDSGQLFFSVRWRADDWVRGKSPDGQAHYPVLSPSFWKPSMSGKWLHLATTFNVETSTVTHYLNGEAIHAEKIPESLMVRTTRIGASTMGNWSIPTKPDAKFAIRNLNGTIDEMLIMNAALDSSEIREIYQLGKP